MGGSDGLDVLRTTKALHPSTAVILMTAFGSVHDRRRGDEERRLRLRAEAVRDRGDGGQDREGARAAPPAARARLPPPHAERHLRLRPDRRQRAAPWPAVLGIVRKVAKSNTTVLIRGETGTGKELIAGAIHHNSLRAGRNFVQGQLRGAPGEPARVRAVRPREGRVHRRRQAAHRPVRAGRRRHAVPRRDRRHERRTRRRRSCACSRSTSSSGSAARGRCSVDVRLIAATNRNLAADGRRRAVPRGPLLPAQRRVDRDAAAARAQGRHPGARRVLHPAVRRRAEEARSTASARTR